MIEHETRGVTEGGAEKGVILRVDLALPDVNR